MVRDTLVKKVFAFRPVGGVKLKKTWCVWRAVQDLIRDQLWQALNVSHRGI